MDLEIQAEIVSRYYSELIERQVYESRLIELQDGSQVRWINFADDVSFNPGAMSHTYNSIKTLGQQIYNEGDYKTTFTHQVGDESVDFVAFDYFKEGIIFIVPDDIPVPGRLNIPPDRVPGGFTEVYLEQGFFITNLRVSDEATSLRGDGSQDELEALCEVENPIDENEIKKFEFLNEPAEQLNRLAVVEACQGSLLVLPAQDWAGRSDFGNLAYIGQEGLCNSIGTASRVKGNGLGLEEYEELRAGACGIDVYGQRVNYLLEIDPSLFELIPQEPIFSKK